MKAIGFLIAVAAFALSSAKAQTVDDLLVAVRSKPRTVSITQSFDGPRYDLKINNLCDEGSLNQLATAYVGPGRWSDLNRALAMTVTLKFPGSKPAIADVVIPLIAMANFGDKGADNCDSLLVSDVPKNQRIITRFDVVTKQFFAIPDKSAFVAALAQVGTSLSSVKNLSALSPFGVAATAGFSFIANNAKPISDLTTATNTLLAQFDVGSSPRPQLRPLERDKLALIFVSGRKDIFGLAKDNRQSVMVLPIIANSSWDTVPNDFAVFGALENTIVSTESSHAPWTANQAEFCADFDRQLILLTKSDQIGIAVGKAYHMVLRTDAYQALNKSCLTPTQVAILKQLKFRQPFAGAYSLKFVGDPLPKVPSQEVAMRAPR